MWNKTLAFSASAILLCSTTFAADVPVNPSDYTGSRSPGAGLTGTADWGSPDGFNLTWNITQTGSTFHYLYTLSIPHKNPSHLLLELSSNVTADNIGEVVSNLTINGSPATPDGPQLFVPGGMGNSNPGLPDEIYGIKIEPFNSADLFEIAFDSVREPMWGDFYSKDGTSGGQDVYIYNSGFGNQPVFAFGDWIPVPNSHGVQVPEPATYLFLTSCLALGLLLRRRQTVTNLA